MSIPTTQDILDSLPSKSNVDLSAILAVCTNEQYKRALTLSIPNLEFLGIEHLPIEASMVATTHHRIQLTWIVREEYTLTIQCFQSLPNGCDNIVQKTIRIAYRGCILGWNHVTGEAEDTGVTEFLPRDLDLGGESFRLILEVLLENSAWFSEIPAWLAALGWEG